MHGMRWSDMSVQQCPAGPTLMRCRFCAPSLMYVSSSSPYVSEWMFSIASWKL